jgi:hypothetical protein
MKHSYSNWKNILKNIFYAIFTLKLTHYIYNTIFKFNDCWVLFVYQVMIHNKCSKFLHLNHPTHRYSDHGLSYTFKDTGAVANILTATKNTFVKRSFIFSWRWIRYGFTFSHRQKCKGLRSTRCWALPRTLKCLRTYSILIQSFFLVLVWETH